MPELSSEGSVIPVEGRDLFVRRSGRTLLNLDHVRFAAEGLTAIVGPNGAGKSLLLRCLCGLVMPEAGAVTWAGKQPSRTKARRLGLLLQSPVLLRRSARANIAYTLRLDGMGRSAAHDAADAALAKADLSHIAGTPARVLSGGEKQRLALVRLLALRPEILFLDEPCASLDPASALAIETMIASARDAGIGVVLVTHDLAQARRLASTVMFMHRGRMVETVPASDFFDTPQSVEGQAFVAGDIVL